jgi:hypothetical protein
MTNKVKDIQKQATAATTCAKGGQRNTSNFSITKPHWRMKLEGKMKYCHNISESVRF